MSPGSPLARDYERIAAELVRAMRGRRSCAELSRRGGYRSNIVHRWELGQCWPSTSRFLRLHQRVRGAKKTWIERFFNMSPSWARELDPLSPEAVAAFLQHLRGKVPLLRVAELAGRNRYSVARWIAGLAEPKLPDFLRLVDACSRRLLDVAAAFEDPERLPSLREEWESQQLAQRVAYELPWSHAVLRALELEGAEQSVSDQRLWISQRLGISAEQVDESLAVLQATSQVKKTRKGFTPSRVGVVDTSREPARAHQLKIAWTETALERMRANAPGRYGYSLFAISRADMTRLHNLHLEYVRAMQEMIASSTPSDCVGLYCAQLLSLDSVGENR